MGPGLQKFEISRRREVLSWPVHREVASPVERDDDGKVVSTVEANNVLDWCEEALVKDQARSWAVAAV